MGTHRAASVGRLCTRAELCGGVRALQEEKARLREVTLRQREELAQLDQECGRLRGFCAEAEHLAQASLAVEECARCCVSDELEQLTLERRRLEKELAAWRGEAARAARQASAEVAHREARAAWLAERKRLEQELAGERARLAALIDAERAEDELRAAQAELADASELRSAKGRHLGQAARERLEADKARLSEARLRLARESEVRRRRADELDAATAQLETLRQEVQAVTGDNSQLRAGLQRTLDGLEYIQRESARAEAYAASLGQPEGVSGIRS